MLSLVGDHILQEFNTLYLTRFRIYKVARPPQTKTQEGRGPQTDKHLPRNPSTGQFVRVTTFCFGVYKVNQSRECTITKETAGKVSKVCNATGSGMGVCGPVYIYTYVLVACCLPPISSYKCSVKWQKSPLDGVGGVIYSILQLSQLNWNFVLILQ